MSNLYHLCLISFLMMTIGFFTYRMDWITGDAIFALWFIGTASGVNGFFWIFPLGYFLVTGSILTRIQTAHKRKIKGKARERSARDWKQLFANGAVAAVFALMYYFTENILFYHLYLTAIAVNLFDTWCSEIGTLFPSKTYSLDRFREVPQGISGGITLWGTLGGVGGLVGYLLMIYILSLLKLIPNISLWRYGLIFISAIGGGFFDSLLGIFEKEEGYEEDDGAIQKADWLKNNMVNFLASIFGSLIFLMLHAYL
ncbi:DUF92 domain-containing protein [Thermotalea metallivorans]|uniref:DUF92 domain-containing protein n=1 Tax=Thermotalea metallivorans TaxID=520762 RepID=A0A140L781_9FIRM|nr:DUF92 domain-containing protein [Thermotalea metallivorans]KXG76406.1 hypothetical protein AN619_09370 [Thermotalea metallivorans]